jgi:cytidine deaminase
MNDTPDELLAIARELVQNCHCPYSGFHVTAVIEDKHGNMFSGVNVENSSYGLTICAERSAVFRAVTDGSTSFRRILVYSPDGEPFPCGACREVLAEFCDKDFQVLIATEDSIRAYTLAELLPHRFRL